MFGAFAAIFIILFLTACPNAAGGTGSGNVDSANGNSSSPPGSFMLNESQQTMYDLIIQGFTAYVANEEASAIMTQKTLKVVNEYVMNPLGCIIEDTTAGTPIAQHTSQNELKQRFVYKKDTSALSPYGLIKSEPAGCFLVLGKYDTYAKKGTFGHVNRRGRSLETYGTITVNAEKTQITYNAEFPIDPSNITNNKITIDGYTFDISALLN